MSVATAIARAGSRDDLVQPDEEALRVGSGTALVAVASVCLLILLSPYEALRPIVELPGQSLTSVEAVLLAVFAACAAAVGVSRQLPQWRTPLTWPWIAVLLTGALATVVATAHRANAVHMTGRVALAFGVYLIAINAITTRATLRFGLIAATIAGVAIAMLVIFEYAGDPFVLQTLRLFRPGVTVIGAQVRAAGPFQYPTIASMYLEIVFAFTLGLLTASAGANRGWTTVALLAGLAVIAEAVTLTFTRTGLLTIASSLVIVGGARWRRHGFDRGAQAVVLVAAIVVLEVVSSRSIEAFRLRMTTETQTTWYQAGIAAPRTLSMRAGSVVAVPITITNTGLITWDPAARHPFRFSYHWIQPTGDRVVVWEGIRTEFAGPVAPGATVALNASVRAPSEPGDFRVLWDVEQEHQLWFSSEPEAPLVATHATVSGPAVAPLAQSRVSAIPKARVRPGRLVLWRAALRMFGDRPLTGVGPDNFRLVYGDYTGIANADPRVHSNNMYLEVLTGTGAFGAVAFLWLGWRALMAFAVSLRSDTTLGAGVAAAGAAIAAHGLVDSFLSFTATYVLMAITLGFAVASVATNGHHAHRV